MNEEERFEELLESDQTDADIQFALALCYHQGDGVESDDQEAMKWLQRAADQGHPDAVAMLRCLTHQEDNITQTSFQKEELLTDSTLPQWCQRAENGDAEAQYRVAAWFLSNQTPNSGYDVERYLGQAVSQGHAEACLLLAKLRLSDGPATEALPLLRNAADCGLSEAMHLLAQCYMGQYGGQVDRVLAERYLTRWASQEGAEAMLELAIRYGLGDGVTPSMAKSMLWIAQVEQAGMMDARERLNGYIREYHAQQAALEEEQRQLEAERQRQQAEQQAALEAERRRQEEAAMLEQQRLEAEAKKIAAKQQRAQALRNGVNAALIWSISRIVIVCLLSIPFIYMFGIFPAMFDYTYRTPLLASIQNWMYSWEGGAELSYETKQMLGLVFFNLPTLIPICGRIIWHICVCTTWRGLYHGAPCKYTLLRPATLLVLPLYMIPVNNLLATQYLLEGRMTGEYAIMLGASIVLYFTLGKLLTKICYRVLQRVTQR